MGLTSKQRIVGDLWGGLASTLVVLPASIAFGVAVFSVLGASFAPQGALWGILGAAAIGIVASFLGGTERLISAPSAPAAAVMGAFVAQFAHRGMAAQPEHILLLMTLLAVVAALLQTLYGILGGGTLIKYIPYPVVSGYMSGVAVVIFLKQLPGLFALPQNSGVWQGLIAPALWQWPALVVGLVTIGVMILAPKVTEVVPAAILGLASGVAAYFAIALARPELLQISNNQLIVGPLGSTGSFTETFSLRWSGLAQVRLSDFAAIAMPVLTLSVLLSIDTLKTCVVVDALTRTRHKSNREIIAQGMANFVSALVGGMPGSGTSGPTLVNLASGAKSRMAGIVEGVLVLVAFLLFGRFIGWTPIAALSGILIVVAWRMFDRTSFRLLKQRSTLLDFVVIATVIAVAIGVGLIAASGVGVALAILLFIRDQIRGSVVHRKTYGNQVFSRQRRLPAEMAALQKYGDQTLVCELQDNLFFGTTDQFFSQLEEDFKTRKYIILDLRRVRSVDLTAAHLLAQIEAQLAERGAQLIFSNLPKNLPTGRHLRQYFDEVGLVPSGAPVCVFDQLSDALEWTEERILEEAGCKQNEAETPLELRQIGFMKGRKEETIQALESCVEEKSYRDGEYIFRAGDTGDELFLIRRGSVRIMLTLADSSRYHVATFGRADFFGELAFLDRGIRSADAIAAKQAEIYIISRSRFDKVAEEHPRLAKNFFADLARAIAIRLRLADGEIRALE